MRRLVWVFAMAFVGVCLLLYVFVLSVCAFMSSDDLSPEIALSTVQPVRSALEVVWVFGSWLSCIAFARMTRWGWSFAMLVGVSMLGFGLYCMARPEGHLQAFSGDGTLRQWAGLVYAVLAAGVVGLMNIPFVRRAFLAGEAVAVSGRRR